MLLSRKQRAGHSHSSSQSVKLAMELTTADVIIKVVNEVGFPIFAFICVCGALVYTSRLHKDEISALKESLNSITASYKEEIDSLKEVISDLKVAITELTVTVKSNQEKSD